MKGAIIGAVIRVYVEKIVAKLTLLALRGVGGLPLGLGRRLGGLLGWLAWLASPREVHTTRRNIAACYPQLSAAEQRQLAHQSVLEAGRMAFEINIVWHKPVAWIFERIVSVSGEELVKDHEQGRGLIFLGPHVGNWEVLGTYIAHFGPSAFLYQPPKKAFLEPMMLAARSRLGAELLPTDLRGVAGLIRNLKKGGVVGILPDQNPEDSGGEFAEFFGHPAMTMTLVHRLIQKTGAKAIMSAAIRVPGGFAIHFWLPPEDIYSDDTAQSLRALNQGVEQSVALAPAQYQWEYKRFRRQPAGRPRFYQR